MTNPCCCSLQAGVKAIGILQIVASVLTIISQIGNIVIAQKELDKTGKEFNNEQIVSFISQFFGLVLGFCLGILLVIGAKNKNPRHCQIWFWVESALLIFYVIIMIWALVVGEAAVIAWVIEVIAVMIQVYFLWVVYCFIQELKA